VEAELQPLKFKIEQLEKTLQGKSSDHNVEIESLLSKVHENEQKVATLDTTKRTLDDKVTALESEVASLN
jgi:peptidoglycan hydrolase CwlO-like protein